MNKTLSIISTLLLIFAGQIVCAQSNVNDCPCDKNSHTPIENERPLN